MRKRRLTEGTDIESEELFVSDEVDDVKAVLDTTSGTDSSEQRHFNRNSVEGGLKLGRKRARARDLYLRRKVVITIRSWPTDFGDR